ncbi:MULTISPECIES: hypothetical protein [unclassified Empedobacter]|uniref:hypothetical protein n=1 Tax=unclassified Empedobacter TaxID=2643773 RepID=UPI000E801FAA|nr:MULTISPECIES: hypothetical protein [unclassified Empedobacter]HBX62634.1 hypothetical protein [Flavobacteriaceae bacterium]
MIIKNKKIYYLISILFIIISIFLLIASKEKQTSVIALLTLLFFGGGAIVFYILNNKFYNNKTKNITRIIGYFIFIILCYATLPFNHLFDGNRKYTPMLGWIVGIFGIPFFCYKAFELIIKVIKENYRK